MIRERKRADTAESEGGVCLEAEAEGRYNKLEKATGHPSASSCPVLAYPLNFAGY